jgi:hypothetical protein
MELGYIGIYREWRTKMKYKIHKEAEIEYLLLSDAIKKLQKEYDALPDDKKKTAKLQMRNLPWEEESLCIMIEDEE